MRAPRRERSATTCIEVGSAGGGVATLSNVSANVSASALMSMILSLFTERSVLSKRMRLERRPRTA